MAEANRNHYMSALVLDDGGNIGVVRLQDSFAVACDSGALTTTLNLTRDETRELALRLLDATQVDRNGGSQ
jgi:hypothetical protein